ncbi:hypothetical protein [Vibrio sp. ZOR0018]|nr:hypothetical protein [Vibrio sp. ZOR0018]
MKVDIHIYSINMQIVGMPDIFDMRETVQNLSFSALVPLYILGY